MKLIVLLTMTFLLGNQSQAACTEKVHSFNMPIIVGTKIFNDRVEICKEKGQLVGQLIVPNRFTAKLENIKIEKDQLSFSIRANEGRGEFQVFYSGRLANKNKHFIGIAKLAGDKILGPFMGVASDKKLAFELVQ